MVRHSALLALGPAILAAPTRAFWLGAAIHCLTAIVWGWAFAAIWPWLRARRVEPTLAGLGFGWIAWMVMHVGVLAAVSPAPPVYTPDSVVIGFFSQMVVFAVPLALTIVALNRRDQAAA